MVVSVVHLHIWFNVFSSLLLNLDCKSRVAAQLLPLEEVETLRTISSKLNNRYWNVTEKSCSGGGGFTLSFALTKALSNVTCNCTFNNNSTCHVTNIQLMGLNLTGQLPDEFSKLAFLQEIELTQNYISGTIPKTFGQLPLKTLSFTDNRIGGSIPPEIANISTLEKLIMEDNLLGGSLPEELGRLSNLRRLLLSSNNFTGTIPETFGHLKNLSDFRIDGNQLSGKMPDFIGNWTKMTILNLQGTSMEGPIPTNISLLKKLKELRISDLNGSVNSFPDLRDMKNMTYLILRTCLISDTIPDYIGGFSSLNTFSLKRTPAMPPKRLEPSNLLDSWS